MAKTQLTIVRHGETEWNIAMRLQGMQNSNLTQRGFDQVRLTAKALQNKSFDRLISSNLERAVKTAEILNKYHNLPLETTEVLRERNFGIMEGLTHEVIMEKFPETYLGYMQRNENYQIPGGESLSDFFTRVTTGIDRLVKENEGKQLLLVSHGGVLDCMMRMIFNYPLSAPRRFSIFNASINIFSILEEEWQLESWGIIDYQRTDSSGIDELRS